jgi:hypothetical protein
MNVQAKIPPGLAAVHNFLIVMSRQGRSPDLGYVDFRMTKH